MTGTDDDIDDVMDRGLVEDKGDRARGLGHRPAALYRFARAGGR